MKKQMIISILMAGNILLSGTIAAQDIFELIEENNVAEIKKLLDTDPSVVNAMDQDGWMPLHWAAWEGHEAVAKLLLEKGANVNIAIHDGITPLHFAAEGGHEAIVKLLIERHANINAVIKGGSYASSIFPAYGSVIKGKKKQIQL